MREDFMNGTDEDVRTMMVTGSSDMPPGIDLLRGVRERQAPARRPQPRYRMRALVSAGAVAVVGGGAVLAATLTATVATAPSAFAAVTAAAGRTSAESFLVSMNVTATERSVQGTTRLDWRVTGESDPSHGVGQETIVSKAALSKEPLQVRFIGQDIYVKVHAPTISKIPGSKPGVSSRPWVEAALWPRLTARQLVVTPDFGSQQAVDPGALLALLKSAGTVTNEGPASGPGWTGTKYGFTVATSGGVSSATGTVYVDSQGEVRRLLTIITLQTGGGYHSTSTEDISFSDFGAPVSVTAPPASQVYRFPGHLEFALVGW
jgi:hypothetical protein